MDASLLQRIKEFNANRVPYVLPLKYKAMAEDAFRFFRGTCHLFYEDLLKNYPLPVSPHSWLCGDLHIENFGSYRGGNRLVYFDLNDFDEAIQAPVLYEVARLMVSVEIAACLAGRSKEERHHLVWHLLDHYRFTLIKNKPRSIEKEAATGLIRKNIKQVSDRSESDLIAQRTNSKEQNAKLLITPRLLPLPKPERHQLMETVSQWVQNGFHKEYTVTDVGFRIAGTGSIGVKRYACLLEHEYKTKRKILLDFKQAMPSCLSPFTATPQPVWQNEAIRVTSIQEIMQDVPPAFLSEFLYQDEWYVVKELQPTADKINLDRTVKQSTHIEQYLADLGMLTASAQLRGTGRMKAATADELQDFATDASWVTPLMDWCMQYAKQVREDYQVFLSGWKDGYFNQ